MKLEVDRSNEFSRAAVGCQNITMDSFGLFRLDFVWKEITITNLCTNSKFQLQIRQNINYKFLNRICNSDNLLPKHEKHHKLNFLLSYEIELIH